MRFFYWLAFLTVIAMTIFAVDNSTAPKVVFKLLIWRFETSLTYTILGSVGVGIFITLICWIPRIVKSSIRLKELKKRVENLERVIYGPAALEGGETQSGMKKAVIIPIYLRFNQLEELPHLEGLSLTKRAIESLKILEDQDFTLILPVCFDLTGGIEDASFLEADRFLRKEIKNLRQGKTILFSSLHLKLLRRNLDQRGFKKFSSLMDLKGFSRIRNIGLLLAQALSMDVVIFIDNDEVVEDPGYLKVACEHLNQERDGKIVLGKGGFYINPDGMILLPPQRLWWRCLWNKTKWMNQVWEEILSSKDRLVPSPMLLGGNLVLHRHLFHSVPFDPYIPRGEDTDYLINASRFGFYLLFDKKLQIKHLHPERMENYFLEELRGDIERFLYEREKVKGGLVIGLNPYPGYFLTWTLYPRAILTSFFLSLDYLIKWKWNKSARCLGNINLIFQKRDAGWLNYLKFKKDWKMVMEEIQRIWMVEILKTCWV
jgi:uncharacterized integral membrane protein/glycosyltransferase involved in cell wall biosynthesis